MAIELITFVETGAFTSRIERLGLEPALRELQEELLEQPERGATDAGTGGLRKIRMPNPTKGKGKSGGARVHYLWVPRAESREDLPDFRLRKGRASVADEGTETTSQGDS